MNKYLKNTSSKLWLRWLLIVSAALLIWFFPVPQGVEDKAWHLLAIFVATIVGIIARPLSMGAIAMIGIIATVLTGTLSIDDALSGFSNRVIWLIVTAFFISRGFIKTGLGERIAYIFIALLGKKSLGLAYGLVATDLVLSPAIPSNTARGGGIIFPIVRSTAGTYQSEPNTDTTRKIGAFLMFTSFQGLNITSAMFLTAMAANPLVVELARGLGVELTWGSWAAAAALPGLLSLLIIPYVIYKLYPPQIKETADAARFAKNKLNEMGKMKKSEWVMLFTFFLLLLLWIFGPYFNLHSTSAALAGIGILLITKVLSWEDILEEHGAWNTLVWFAALVMMASFLNELGLIPWFSETIKNLVQGTDWVSAFIILALVYFYSHYFFASNTAHVSSMYVPFLAVAIALGTPAILAALVLGFFSNLFSSMTHYGTGPAPVFYGSGYVELNTWWKLGFLISLINILIWVGVGGFWWKLLNLW
jgi:DASS family divalent anion:Na+ symporter